MKFLSISSALLLLVVSQTAVAMPYITGSIDITGNSVVLDDGTNATGINWIDLDSNLVNGDTGVVSAATGSFASLATFPLTTATLTDFTFASLPVADLWSAGIFSFELTSVTVDSFTKGQLLNLSGAGVISAAGYADTAGVWDYSSQSGLSFSSNTVPEPSIAALIGIGLLGFGFLSRRQKK